MHLEKLLWLLAASPVLAALSVFFRLREDPSRSATTIPQVVAMGCGAGVQFVAVAVIGLAPSLAAKQDAYLVWLAAIPIYLYIGGSIVKKRANQAYDAVVKRRKD